MTAPNSEPRPTEADPETVPTAPLGLPRVIFKVSDATVQSIWDLFEPEPLNVRVVETNPPLPRSMEPKWNAPPQLAEVVETDRLSLPAPPSVTVTVTTLFDPTAWSLLSFDQVEHTVDTDTFSENTML